MRASQPAEVIATEVLSNDAPQLIFFVELEAAALVDLFARPGLIGFLAGHGYGVALGMLDLDSARAGVIRRLVEHGVPVTAWLLLLQEAGYWLNVENYPQAIARYHELRTWATAEELHFTAIGLDMEPSHQRLEDLRSVRSGPLFSRVVAAQRNALFPAAVEAYQHLAATIRADGYAVHTYQYPFLVDDRRMATTLIQRMLNVVAIPADVEVLMCYSSMVPRRIFGSDLSGALVAAYGPHADSIGIGSTGGGIVLNYRTGERAPRLSWHAFARDLRIAATYTDTIHVFSLEGCAATGFIEGLDDFDWSAPVHIPRRHRVTMHLVRFGIDAGLWWSRFGLTVLGWLGWVVVAIMLLRRAFTRLRRWQWPSSLR